MLRTEWNPMILTGDNAMLCLRHFAFAFVSALLVIGTARAQDSANATTQKPSAVTITATASTDHLRIAATASIVQMHVEVFAVRSRRCGRRTRASTRVCERSSGI